MEREVMEEAMSEAMSGTLEGEALRFLLWREETGSFEVRFRGALKLVAWVTKHRSTSAKTMFLFKCIRRSSSAGRVTLKIGGLYSIPGRVQSSNVRRRRGN